jgi:hypothetical protein
MVQHFGPLSLDARHRDVALSPAGRCVPASNRRGRRSSPAETPQVTPAVMDLPLMLSP